ncbi:MAG: hypoxanthine phosphoribosyltransferase [bacterium]|nr:hypoxanthine phosphoribosyltransferase [bacterium]
MSENKLETLIGHEKIAERVAELGAAISKDYEGQEILIVCVLRGAQIFAADLMRNIPNDIVIDFISVSSYGASTNSSGVVRFLKDLEESVQGRHVLIVEDIVDTGLTLTYLVDNIRARGPMSLRTCALLDKPSRRKVDIKPDYCGFAIPDFFVVGYGFDNNQKYRNQKNICILEGASEELL